MSTHGGARKGAGRKTDVERKVAKNQQFDLRATEDLPEFYDALKALALGVKVAVYRKPKGSYSEAFLDSNAEEVFVYREPPDKDSLKYLVDRSSGRAAVKSQADPDTTVQIICEIPRPRQEEDVNAELNN
jgi:hypothetical protein